MNRLYYGDNLHVLCDRQNFPGECVDLIYLDPPFNSKRDYNLLFKSPKVVAGGESVYSAAQIEAFLDTWHWTSKGAEREFDEVIKGPNTNVSEMMQALVKFLGRNDMTAYLVMMGSRLLALHRVLKPTGSLYLHCDPTASAYLKIVLDAVFGKENFRSEIAWRRSGAHNDANRYGANHDVVFFYSKGARWTWNQQFAPYSETYIKQNYRYRDEKGLFRVSDLTANKPGGDVSYDWTTPNGQTVRPYKGRFWAYSKENMQKMQDAGLIFYRNTGMPVLKHYLDEMPGVPLQTFWHDLPPIISGSPEDLGYPTQKPLALLERIVSASSNPGDVVLDPFCGCGTAVHAAQKLGRRWLGIDITCLAISLIESRLKKAFPEHVGKKAERLQFEVVGTPKDLESARDLARRDKYQFQWWAVSLIDEAQPWQGKKKGADTGIDGIRYFRDLDRKEVHAVLISVKGGENVGPAMVKDLIATLARDKADIGLFITLAEPTRAMRTEAAAAGFYASPNGKKFARLQLLTIAGLLDGTQRPEHPDYEPDTGFKKAKAENSGEQAILL